MPFLYEHAVRRREGEVGLGGAFVVNTGKHTGRSPARQIHRRRTRYPRVGRLGQRQPGDHAGPVCQPAPARARLSAGPGAVRSGPLCRRRPGIPAAGAGGDAERLAQPLRAQHVHPSAPCGAAGLPARLHHPPRAAFPLDPRARRHPVGDLHLRQFRRAAGADRRHRICRRDQEMRLRLSQFRAADQGRAADALLGQCRPQRRQRDLLRSFRHRQDDLVGRRVAHPDRRRRARLEPARHLQFRGRLLRQGDQPVAQGRARDLRDDHPLRHGAGKRRAQPAHPDARCRRRQPDREHPRLLSARLHPERIG